MRGRAKGLTLAPASVSGLIVPDKSIYEVLASLSADRDASPAIDYLGTTITYADLIKRVEEAASAFVRVGIREGMLCPS